MYCACWQNWDAGLLLASTRSHWRVENAVRWALTVAFREGNGRIRQSRAQRDPAILRRLALNLLRREKSALIGTAAKRNRVGWKTDRLRKILSR